MQDTEFTLVPRRGDIVEWAVVAQAMFGLVLIFGLVYTITVGYASQSAGFEDRESGTPLLQIFAIAAYLPAALWILAKPDLPMRTIMHSRAFFLLIIWAGVSYLWSVEPEVTGRRIVALALATVFVLGVATWFPFRRFLTIFVVFAAIVLVGSTLAVGIPGMGITPDGVHAGKMRGLFVHKNIFGDFLAVAMFSLMVAAGLVKDKRLRMALLALLALGFVDLLATNSRTPLLSLTVTGLAMLGARFLYIPGRIGRKLGAAMRQSIVAICVIIGAVIVPMVAALVLAALGRDMTLSGRTRLWEYAIDKGWQNPWTGVGYKAFWTDKITFDLRVLHDHWSTGEGAKALTANAHNGFLDTWLDLGVVGLALLLMVFIGSAIRANVLLKRTKDPIYLWHIGALTYAAFYYLTESGVMQQNSLSWFLVSFVALSLAAQTARLRSAKRLPAPRATPVPTPARPVPTPAFPS